MPELIFTYRKEEGQREVVGNNVYGNAPLHEIG